MTSVMLLLAGLAHATSPGTTQARALLQSVSPDGKGVTSRSSKPWWSTVDDPALHGLILDGMRHSPEIAATGAQVRIAQAGRQQSLSGLLPSLSVEIPA